MGQEETKAKKRVTKKVDGFIKVEIFRRDKKTPKNFRKAKEQK